MTYRTMNQIDNRTLQSFAVRNFYNTKDSTANDNDRSRISKHVVCELSGITDEGQSWVAYFNSSTQRAAIWMLRNKHHSSTVGNYLAGWTELSGEAMDKLINTADSGSLKVEQYLAATLPYWFWDEKLATQFECETHNRALRKATLLDARETAISLTMKTVSTTAVVAFGVNCVAFWVGVLGLVA
jgi:hypothetical protein